MERDETTPKPAAEAKPRRDVGEPPGLGRRTDAPVRNLGGGAFAVGGLVRDIVGPDDGVHGPALERRIGFIVNQLGRYLASAGSRKSQVSSLSMTWASASMIG